MYFELTEEQRELAGLTREVLSDQAGPELLRRLDGEDGPAAAERLWQQVVEVGLTGLLLAEDEGGLGVDEVCLVAVAEEFGRSCLPLPLTETIALAPELGDGEPAPAAWAGEPRPGHGALTAWPNLVKQVVIDDRRHDAAAGSFSPTASVDRTRPLAEFTPGYDGVALDDGPLARARATVGTAAELIGLSRAMLALACDYVPQRQQFGVPIGSFQAVKHHLADCRIAIDFAAPAVNEAAWLLSARGPGDPRSRLILAQAKQRANEAALTTARWVIQCHGGMGYTTEYDLHFFAKRAWALAVHHGSSRRHRRTIIDHLGLAGAGRNLEGSIR
ncbi:acyl-CoA dehydrogenase [Enemella dayhoffiae]|uniref:Acyl-CoA dehydrogenase n=1 Tax=Enemella dayhoffiae TaxID=2016507 RepID=A0A255HCI7_9ACTN|nr:acyl-CoA dehydrogenase family protein [Enemella dayhoffiae]OYO24693.1 acyl-CoA dehydrogenase [Enemella dayhoffiae]